MCTKHPKTGEDVVVEKYEFKLTYMSEDGSTAPTFNGAAMDSKDDLKVRVCPPSPLPPPLLVLLLRNGLVF